MVHAVCYILYYFYIISLLPLCVFQILAQKVHITSSALTFAVKLRMSVIKFRTVSVFVINAVWCKSVLAETK